MDGLSGSIKTMPLRDLVLYIGSRQLSGILQCEQGHLRKSVVVHGGSAVMASSSHPQEYFSEMLVLKGFIDQAQLQQALQQGGSQPLGRSLVSIGILNEERVREALQLKIRDTVMSLMDWTAGSFQFVEENGVTRAETNVDAMVDLLLLYKENYSDLGDHDLAGRSWMQLHQVIKGDPDGPRVRSMLQDGTTAVGDVQIDSEFADVFRRDVENRLAERGRGKRFPKDLQKRAVHYYRGRTQQGSFLSEVARELGLPPPTLRRWVLDAPPEHGHENRALSGMALQSAGLSLAQGAGSPVLVGPNGLRIEGLDVTSLAELLRRLDV